MTSAVEGSISARPNVKKEKKTVAGCLLPVFNRQPAVFS
jgi:hypothetical protein